MFDSTALQNPSKQYSLIQYYNTEYIELTSHKRKPFIDMDKKMMISICSYGDTFQRVIFMNIVYVFQGS